LLVELVHVDLDVRLRAGEGVWAEDYIDRFPVLRSPDVMVDLLAAEYGLRARLRPPVWPEEFWLRFPELTAELRVRLPAENRPGWFDETRPQQRPGRPIAGPPVIPGYDVLDELGRGGMGVVYRVHDRTLNRTVAVKTFATIPRTDDRARFAREAEAIARLDHPHIVPVYKVGEWAVPDGSAVPYFVMKWYPGGSLDAAPAGPGTPPAHQARAIELIADAVHHAHERGILHRDLKPSNILLDGAGQPHVADFGLAGRVDPAVASAVSAVVAGTPAYMAPEQAKDPSGVSVATDVYGLGAILYHQLTGRAPFSGDSPLATLALVESAPAGPPSRVNPAVPRDLDVITLKCLEKNPARRYTTAAALAEDLERWRTGRPITARPVPAWERAWRRVRRHPLIAGLAASTLVALVAAVAILADSNARIRAKERETSDALTRETRLLRQFEAALAREQNALYLERVAAAGRLYAANQLPQAWALLDQCPPHLRGWEWRYLNSLRTDPAVKLTGHTDLVIGAGFLADGRLVTVDTKGNVRVWDPLREKTIASWTVKVSIVTGIDIHPTKNWVAVAGHNGVVVLDVDSGTPVARPAGSRWVAFRSDGKMAATANGSVVRLWTIPDWEPAGKLSGHENIVLFGAFRPDGRHLVTSASDRTVRTWDLETRTQVKHRSVPSPVPKLVYTPDGETLAECYMGSVLLTHAETGELQDRIDHPSDDRTIVGFQPDTHTMAVGGAKGEVVVWDRDRHRPVRIFRGHTARISTLAFGPEGRLVSAGGDTVVMVWDPTRDSDSRSLVVAGFGNGKLAVAPDGTWVAVGPRLMGKAGDSWTVVLDPATGREMNRFPGSGDLAVQGSTGLLAIGRPDGGITLLNPKTGAAKWSRLYPPDLAGQAVEGNNCRIAFSPAGDRLATWVFGTKEIQLWDPADGTEIGRLPFDGTLVYALAFTQDGSKLAVAFRESFHLWDFATRTRISCPIGGGVLAATYSPDGEWLATVEADRTVRLRNAATGEIVRPLIGPAAGVVALAFSPDGRRLATGGIDKTVRVWDVESGNELLALTGPTEIIQSIAWDRAGGRLFVFDDSVRVWSPDEK
jgi:WD40 repeat protein